MVARVGLYDVGMVGEAFSYVVPLELQQSIQVGLQVVVPVGEKEKIGIVLELLTENEDQLKPVIKVLYPEETPLLNVQQGLLVLWMAWYYRSPLHKVLRIFIPEKIWNHTYHPEILWEYTPLITSTEVPTRSKKLKKVIELLEAREDLRIHSKEFPERFLREIIEKGFVSREYCKLAPVRPSIVSPEDVSPMRPMTSEQRHIAAQLREDSDLHTFLLFGVTGSGKTHIYLDIAMRMRSQGKQTLLLVPEIALTPQLISYFLDTFGESISVFHSHLSQGEKHQEWLRVKRKESMLVIGSRSAIFAPLEALGAIIIDEEHEWTYKNEQNPRYHTRNVAEKMIQLTPQALLVLGSATPSVETMYRALQKDIGLLTLDKRIFEQSHDDMES